MFKKRMNITRFHCVQESNISQQDFLDGLAEYVFDANNLLDLKEVVGFTTVEEPYEGTNFVDSEVFHGNIAVGVFRRDTRNVPGSAIKRELTKKIESRKKELGKKFVSRETRKEFKESITMRLLSSTPFKTELIPFLFDLKTGVGYFCNTGSSAYSSFEDVFSRAMGVSIEIKDFDCGEDFLSWLWWRLETNDLNQPEGAELAAGSRFSVTDGDGKALSGSSSEGEIRLAVSENCNITKMTVLPIGEEKELVVDHNGKVSSLSVDKEDLPDSESNSVIPLFDRFDRVFKIFDTWAEEYRNNPRNVENFHASKKAWARPSVCGAAFDDV